VNKGLPKVTERHKSVFVRRRISPPELRRPEQIHKEICFLQIEIGVAQDNVAQRV
jgi:hypothetical protein